MSPLDINDMKSLEDWFSPRFNKVEERLDDLQKEMVERSHAVKGSVESMAVQIAEIAVGVGELRKGMERIDMWREEDGPLDRRLKRHSDRMDAFQNWQTGAKYVAGLATLIVTTTFGWIVSGRA